MRFPKWPRWVWRCYAATFAAVVAFLICSFYPMWRVLEVWISYQCGLGRTSTLWAMLTYREPMTDDCYVEYHWEKPAIITAMAMQVAAIVGAILGGIRWRKPKPSVGDATIN